MKKKTRGTPRRKVRRKTTTAIARRPEAVLAPLVEPSMLTSEPIMVPTFVGTFHLTAEQISALRRPVQDDEVDWKPAVIDGPPVIPYLSHNGYRDRLDAAFGLGGWGMLPIGQPKKEKDTFIYVPYALVVAGTPRIYTWGEQQIHKMTYGDALEGCKSNAIVRCGKELGIARELWDRKYIAALLARRGKVPADGSTRASTPRAGFNDRDDEPITQKQRQRLWTIVKHSGRTDHEVAVFLREMFNIDDTRKIARGDYNDICSAIERPGELPRPPAPARGEA